MTDKKPAIKYTSRDFETLKRDFQEYVKREYSHIAKDMSEAGWNAAMLDLVAYVGDQLSFLVDFSVNESFLDTAIVPDNILKHGRANGFKYSDTLTSYGFVATYILVPAATDGGPDLSYAPILRKGSEFASVNGGNYILIEDIDFSDANNEVVVAKFNDTTGEPTKFAIKSYGQVMSGEIRSLVVDLGEFTEFRKINIPDSNIVDIISVVDSQGRKYYEVEHLSQDHIMKTVVNREDTTNSATDILKPFPVPRRFTVVSDRNTTYLQFGHGSDSNTTEVSPVDPSNMAIQMHGKNTITDKSFDPNKLISSDKMGISPANTRLKIIYRTNASKNANAAPGSVTRIARPILDFGEKSTLNQFKINEAADSLQVDNEDPITGDISNPNSQELKLRIKSHFATQNRAVTVEDYKSIAYNMPAKLGGIKRVSIVKDEDSFKRNLNMYVISENVDGTLTPSNDIIKKNLKLWIIQHKMIHDTIDILDARIVNFGINFTIVVEKDRNPSAVRVDAIRRLGNEFTVKQEIGEPLSISKIYKVLNRTPGVVDAVDVKIEKKSGGNYSDTSFSIRRNLSPDGRFLWVPKDVILELKYLARDIKGVTR